MNSWRACCETRLRPRLVNGCYFPLPALTSSHTAPVMNRTAVNAMEFPFPSEITLSCFVKILAFHCGCVQGFFMLKKTRNIVFVRVCACACLLPFVVLLVPARSRSFVDGQPGIGFAVSFP